MTASPGFLPYMKAEEIAPTLLPQGSGLQGTMGRTHSHGSTQDVDWLIQWATGHISGWSYKCTWHLLAWHPLMAPEWVRKDGA